MVEIVADEYRRLIESEVSRVINLRAAKRQKLLDVQIERVEIEASLVRMATVEQSSSNRTDAFDAAYPLAERAQKLKEEEKMLTMWLQTVNMRIREELDRIESTYWDELSNFKDSLIKSIVKRMGIASGTTAT